MPAEEDHHLAARRLVQHLLHHKVRQRSWLQPTTAALRFCTMSTVTVGTDVQAPFELPVVPSPPLRS